MIEDDLEGAAAELFATIESHENDHPSLRRVLREATGRPASPTAYDYVTAVDATGGDVALELEPFREPNRAAIRGGDAVPPDVDAPYQIAGRRGEGDDAIVRSAPLEQSAVHTQLAGVVECELTLAVDVADLFDAASSIAPTDQPDAALGL